MNKFMFGMKLTYSVAVGYLVWKLLEKPIKTMIDDDAIESIPQAAIAGIGWGAAASSATGLSWIGLSALVG